MKRIIAVLLSLMTVFSLSSCNGLDLGVENLMHPPRPDKQQEEIRLALEKELGTDAFSLRTPRGSDQQSAVFYSNLYGDESHESVVLYSLDSAPEKVRLQVLTRDGEGSWTAISDFSVADGSSVARVEFAAVAPTGYSQILVGTTLYTGRENVLNIWSVDRGEEENLYSSPYSRMIASDLDSDGRDEIAVFTTLADGSGTAAHLLGYSDAEKTVIIESAELLDVQFASWMNVQVGSLDTGSKAVFIDGRLETDTYTTEVVAVISGQLVKVLSNRPTRNVAVSCRDIDGDGTLEIPVQEILPGYADAAAADRIPRIDWSSCNTAGLTLKVVSVVNPKWGYILTVPERYVGSMTVISDESGNAWTLCVWDSEKQAISRKLCTVYSQIASEWDENGQKFKNQLMFKQIGNVCYTVEYYGEQSVSTEELKSNLFAI